MSIRFKCSRLKNPVTKSIVLESEVRDKLLQIAKNLDLNFGEVVRIAIDQFLEGENV